MIDRNYLNKTILLCSENGKFPVRFSIKEIISPSGQLAVCYAAEHENGTMGVLKEFYPLSVHSLMRDENGQLVKKASMCAENEKFDSLLKDYLKPYRILSEARKKYADLTTFIPRFEICFGCSESCDRIGTVYIWSPESRVKTFDDFCGEIHDQPSVRPEYNLLRVMYSIESLTNCMISMHKAGLIHRDIKPSNFGFKQRGDELLTQTISLFDVDTVCSVYDVYDEYTRGSDGFLEPEYVRGEPNNLTDIFAIGASLFYAIIVNDDVKKSDYLYDKSYYPNLKQLVDESELIQASTINSHPYVRSVLTKILQKTLCPRENRYQSCEELLEDARKAIFYLVPAKISDKGNPGEQWVLADVDKLKVLDICESSNSLFVLQYHLYNYPLFEWCQKEKSTLDVLVIGFGKHGQEFTDIALQVAQIPGKRLRVMVVSLSCEDKFIYLSDRPELDRFFNIDDSLPGDLESYGDIYFIEHEFSTVDENDNIEFLEKLFSEFDFKPDYAFTAVGRDYKNLFIAKSASHFCKTSIVWEGRRISNKELDTLIPVYVSEDISSSRFFCDVERLAYNVHLVCNRNLNLDVSDVRKEFKKPYNHNSYVSFALAIKYKLYAIGIDIESHAKIEIAKLYSDYIMNHEEQKRMLVYYEHRRWVTEKLCLGYTQITNIDECANGKIKDEKNKRHVCIVRSTSDVGLSGADWLDKSGRINKAKWDNPSQANLSRLDELDRMSVELHLMYLKYAKTELKDNIFNGEIVSAVTNQIENDVGCIVSFQELLTCMKDIRQNDSEQCIRFEGLLRVFMDKVKSSAILSDIDKKSVKRLVELLKEKFNPILAGQEYRDYKKDDANLIDSIPFILTYTDSLYMAIPYNKSNHNNELFDNLAAPTVVNPSKILYLVYCNNYSDIEKIKNNLPYMASYMEKKKFRANVEFVIGLSSSKKIANDAELEKSFRFLSNKRVSAVKLICANSIGIYAEMLKMYLISRQKRKANTFILQLNETNLSGAMEALKISEDFSTFRFNSEKMEFDVVHNCDIVKYIHAKPFITVSDMFALKMSTSTTSNKPEFFSDYKTFMSKYLLYTKEWKYLCKCCKDHSSKKDLIVKFERMSDKAAGNTEYTYTIPFRCKKNVEMILRSLIEMQLIKDSSYIKSTTTYSCIVVIRPVYNYQENFDILFSRIDILLQTDFVFCKTDPLHHVVRVVYNNLIVNDLDCKNLGENGYLIMRELCNDGYIINLSCDKVTKKASFTYTTPQIKDLLTNEGRILEIFVYHKAKEIGEFDDIRSSFEIEWEDGYASNEFDCVITKGFSTLFVECKETNNLQTDFYTRMNMLVSRFGINAKAVIIADTQDNSDTAPINNRYREYGEQLGVITISDRSQFDRIGSILLDIVNNDMEQISCPADIRSREVHTQIL